MSNLKQLATRRAPLCGGHRACAGCSAPNVVRQVLMASADPVVVGSATGCLEVTTTIFPYSAWNVPFVHSAFENAGASVSGIEAAYKSLKKQGKIADEKINFVAFGGDGGTYDIGFQSLSGAMERGHNLLYVCYDNGAYMNTGIQRSSATPRGAMTTTSPVGKVVQGKQQQRKDLTACMVAHEIPYVAQTTPAHWRDLNAKAEYAFSIDGPKFMNVLAPCRLGWGFPMELTMEMCRLAADTCFWPLYEVVDGRYKLTYTPREKKPIEDFLKLQTRFRHLFRPENEHVIAEIQQEVDRKWERLQKLCKL